MDFVSCPADTEVYRPLKRLASRRPGKRIAQLILPVRRAQATISDLRQIRPA